MWGDRVLDGERGAPLFRKEARCLQVQQDATKATTQVATQGATQENGQRMRDKCICRLDICRIYIYIYMYIYVSLSLSPSLYLSLFIYVCSWVQGHA